MQLGLHALTGRRFTGHFQRFCQLCHAIVISGKVVPFVSYAFYSLIFLPVQIFDSCQFFNKWIKQAYLFYFLRISAEELLRV